MYYDMLPGSLSSFGIKLENASSLRICFFTELVLIIIVPNTVVDAIVALVPHGQQPLRAWGFLGLRNEIEFLLDPFLSECS